MLVDGREVTSFSSSPHCLLALSLSVDAFVEFDMRRAPLKLRPNGAVHII